MWKPNIFFTWKTCIRGRIFYRHVATEEWHCINLRWTGITHLYYRAIVGLFYTCIILSLLVKCLLEWSIELAKAGKNRISTLRKVESMCISNNLKCRPWLLLRKWRSHMFKQQRKWCSKQNIKLNPYVNCIGNEKLIRHLKHQ